MSIIEALEYQGIEDVEQIDGESDFVCAKRVLKKAGVSFGVKEEKSKIGNVNYIIFSKLTTDSIAAKVTMESALHSILMTQPYIEFIDDELVSY